MQIFRLLGALTLALALTACLKAHRIDIQQGNLITSKEVNQLTPGMSKREVRYVLGTPLIVDPFHQNRWDYYYSLDLGYEEVARRRVTIVFEEDKLVRIEGDIEANTAGQQDPDTVLTQSPDGDKGFFSKTWDKIKIWDKDEE